MSDCHYKGHCNNTMDNRHFETCQECGNWFCSEHIRDVKHRGYICVDCIDRLEWEAEHPGETYTEDDCVLL